MIETPNTCVMCPCCNGRGVLPTVKNNYRDLDYKVCPVCHGKKLCSLSEFEQYMLVTGGDNECELDEDKSDG